VPLSQRIRSGTPCALKIRANSRRVASIHCEHKSRTDKT
jgi:hypothetical protein